MSDFSELCPVFNTGVFREMLFPNIKMTNVSTTANALTGTDDCQASSLGNWLFSRTIIITEAWVKKISSAGAAETMTLQHKTSARAAGTNFATLNITVTITGQSPTHGIYAMNMIANGPATFTSAAVLALNYGTATAASGGVFDLYIRYKDA